jgi:hypothetical protein
MNFCTSVQDVCDEGLILSVHEVPIGPVWKLSNSLKMSRGVHRVELSLLLCNISTRFSAPSNSECPLDLTLPSKLRFLDGRHRNVVLNNSLTESALFTSKNLNSYRISIRGPTLFGVACLRATLMSYYTIFAEAPVFVGTSILSC